MSSGDMEISEKLAKLVRNQSEVSRRTGIAQSALSEASAGKRRLYLDQAFRIAQAVGVSLDYLADDTLDEPPLPEPELSQDEQLALDFYRSMREHDGATAVLKVLARMADQGIGAADERSRAASAQRRPEDEPVKVIQPTRVESTPKRRKTI